MKSFLLTFTALFVALDIIGTLPIFISMTRRLDTEAQRRTVHQSMGVALVVAVGFAFIGSALFDLLGIQIFDFKIAGGLILLLVSLADLLGHPEYENRVSGSTGIVPLAVPLITGPAVLTTLILQVGNVGYLLTLLALVINYFIAWILLMQSRRINRLIGNDGTLVLSKIASLLLAAIAVAMIRSGVFESIRSL